MRTALYVRVSTDDQTVQNQIRELKLVGKRLGWTVTGTYTDQGISGSKGRDQRPAFDQLLKGVARREFDLVAAWSVDRLGRSLQDLVAFLSELQSRNVGLFLLRQNLDTSSPSGKAMFGMLSVFSEFERSMIAERVRSGLARARAEGKRLGRPTVSDAVTDRVRAELGKGTGIHKTARTVGCGVSVVQRVRKSMQAAA
jgi:DNA invertase Pin-like site-specific DNA recombinase